MRSKQQFLEMQIWEAYVCYKVLATKHSLSQHYCVCCRLPNCDPHGHNASLSCSIENKRLLVLDRFIQNSLGSATIRVP